MILHNAWVHQTDLLFLKFFVSISGKSHLSSFFFLSIWPFKRMKVYRFFFCLSVCVPNNNYQYVLILRPWLSDELVLSFVSYLLLCPHTLLHWFDLSVFTDLEPKLCILLFAKACDIHVITSDVWLDWIPWWLRW